MKISRLQYLVIAVTVISALFGGAAVAVAAQRPDQGGPSIATKAVGKATIRVDTKVDKAARADAREKKGKASWSAFNAARHEPRMALKGIKMTSSVKDAARFIEERYLDRFEELDKADKNAYYTAKDTSCVISGIAALRLEQRKAIRATLTREQRIQFDSNVVALIVKEGV